jgi:hypothetical protein
LLDDLKLNGVVKRVRALTRIAEREVRRAAGRDRGVYRWREDATATPEIKVPIKKT